MRKDSKFWMYDKVSPSQKSTNSSAPTASGNAASTIFELNEGDLDFFTRVVNRFGTEEVFKVSLWKNSCP